MRITLVEWVIIAAIALVALCVWRDLQEIPATQPDNCPISFKNLDQWELSYSSTFIGGDYKTQTTKWETIDGRYEVEITEHK